MPLTVPEALGFIPKAVSLVTRAVETTKKIRELPVKNAASIGEVLGVAPGSFLHDVLDLGDDVVAAAKS